MKIHLNKIKKIQKHNFWAEYIKTIYNYGEKISSSCSYPIRTKNISK